MFVHCIDVRHVANIKLRVEIKRLKKDISLLEKKLWAFTSFSLLNNTTLLPLPRFPADTVNSNHTYSKCINSID